MITRAFIAWQQADAFPLFWPLFGVLTVVAFCAWLWQRPEGPR